jgi:hypothetical protein
MSRCSRSSRTSRRSFTNSPRSSVVRPVLPLLRSARACFTQLPTTDCETSRSRPTCETVLPSSSTSRTAPALNSSVKLRRTRFFAPVAIRAIVSAFHLASTGSDQAQSPAYRARVGGRRTSGAWRVAPGAMAGTSSEPAATFDIVRSLSCASGRSASPTVPERSGALRAATPRCP